jgi:membrane associated rhomboid family serine protease
MNLNLTDVVKNLLIINILVYFGATSLLNDQQINEWLAVHYPASENFKPVQILTYMFMHGSISHLFFNMFGLFMFGPPVEHTWGPKRFLVYYLFTGFGALVLDFAVKYFQLHYTNLDPQEAFMITEVPMVGASGAIFGLLAAYGMLFPNNIIMLMFPPIPMKAKYFVIIFGILELFLGIRGEGNIAHFAHVGGALFGFLLIMYWRNGGTLGR